LVRFFFFSPSAGLVDFLAFGSLATLLAGAFEAVEAGFFSAVVDFGGILLGLKVFN
jgi:hypothetical protein